MHRFLSNAKKDDVADHKNGDTLNNLEENLRVCNRRENASNRQKQTNNTSGHSGVTWNKTAEKWMAYIAYNYKDITLGYFDMIKDAVECRKRAEEKYFGEFNRNKNNE